MLHNDINGEDFDKPVRRRELSKLTEAKNIAKDLDDDELEFIARTVLSEFDVDDQDPERQKKARKWEAGRELITQDIGDSSGWKSNFKYPLISNAAIQFSSHASPVLITAQGIVKKKIIGREKKQAQIQQGMQQPAQPQQMPMPQQQELMQLAGAQGPMPERAQRSKDQVADDVAELHNYQLTCESDEWIDDTDRLLMLQSVYGVMYRKTWYSKIKGRIVSKILTPKQFVLPALVTSIEESPRSSELFTYTSNQVEARIRSGEYIDFDYAKYKDNSDSEKPLEFIEQHRYLDLDEDGYKEPYIVTVNRETQAVCRLVANFKREDVFLGDKDRVADIKKIEYYVEYPFIPSMDDECTLPIGFFDLLAPMNRAINANVNQLIDAATLANNAGGFIGKDLKMNRGTTTFGMGEFKSVNARGDDIRKGIVHMQFPGPNVVLFQLMQFLLSAARELANTQDIMENAQKSNMPATTTMALVEQGAKTINAIYKRIQRSFKKEFKIRKRLNAEYLDPGKYSEILDIQVTNEDFLDKSYDYELVADPEEISDMQRMSKINFLLPLMGNPYLDNQKLLKRILDYAKIPNAEELVIQPQPQSDPRAEIEGKKLELKDKEIQVKTMAEVTKMQLLKEESDSKIIKNKTSAIKDLADAEAQEAGQQLQQYQHAMQDLENERQFELQQRENERADRQQEFDAAAQGAEQTTPVNQ